MEAFHSRPVDADLFPSSDIPREAPASRYLRHSALCDFPQKIWKPVFSSHLLCAKAGLTQSMSEAKRLIEQGGIYINERQVKTVDEKLLPDDFAGGTELRIRKGKKKYLMVELAG